MIESASLPVIRGYRNMLEYLFLHIIDNALKFHNENNSPRIIIVETHEGFIDALPLAENGAIFNCYFPIVEEE